MKNPIAKILLLMVSGGLVSANAGDRFYAHNRSVSQFNSESVAVLAAKKTKKASKKYRQSKPLKHAFPATRKATGKRVFIFSPRHVAWAVYNESGHLVRVGRASGGKAYCPDIGRRCYTPRGVFSVKSKGSKYCRSTRYPRGRGGAPMPYCMFFHGNYAIHGSPDVPNYNASHGCIRVKPPMAEWLRNSFLRVGSTVIVTSY